MRLIDYDSNDRCFEFEADSGTYSRIRLPETRTRRAGYAGAAQLVRSLREGKVLLAKYLRSGEPWFSIGAQNWPLFTESLVVAHEVIRAGLVCELSLYREGHCIRRLRYLRRDWFASLIDPAYDYMDFSLAHVAADLVPHELSSLAKQREDFVKMWSADYGSSRASTPEDSSVRR